MIATLLLAALFAGDDADAKDARAAFKKAFRTREASDRASAVEELAKVQHSTITRQLAQLLMVDAEEVRTAAAIGLGGASEDAKRATTYLAAGIKPNSKYPAVIAAILESLGKLKASSQLRVINKQFTHSDLSVASAAIGATGVIRHKSSIPVLILQLKNLDAVKKMNDNNKDTTQNRVTGNGGGFNFGGKRLPNAGGEDRGKTLIPAVNAALTSITGEKITGYKEWTKWWIRNRSGYKVPKEDPKKKKKE